MAADSPAPVVRQLRLVVEAADHEAAVAFFRDALGLPEEAAFSGDGDARVVILDAGRATLEIANPAQKRMIDEVEAGRQVAPRIRVAFEVDDARGDHRPAGSRRGQRVAPAHPHTLAVAQLPARRPGRPAHHHLSGAGHRDGRRRRPRT